MRLQSLTNLYKVIEADMAFYAKQERGTNRVPRRYLLPSGQDLTAATNEPTARAMNPSAGSQAVISAAIVILPPVHQHEQEDSTSPKPF